MYANKLITHTYTCAQLTCTAATLSGAPWCCRWMMDGVRVRTGDTREHPFISVTRLIPLSSHPLRHSAFCQPPPPKPTSHSVRQSLTLSLLRLPTFLHEIHLFLSFSLHPLYSHSPLLAFNSHVFTFIFFYDILLTLRCVTCSGWRSIRYQYKHLLSKFYLLSKVWTHFHIWGNGKVCPNLRLVLFVKAQRHNVLKLLSKHNIIVYVVLLLMH